MENRKRALLTKKLEEAKEDAKRKEASIRELERAINEMDQIEAQKLLKKYHLTPGELDEILAKRKKENDELLKKEGV